MKIFWLTCEARNAGIPLGVSQSVLKSFFLLATTSRHDHTSSTLVLQKNQENEFHPKRRVIHIRFWGWHMFFIFRVWSFWVWGVSFRRISISTSRAPLGNTKFSCGWSCAAIHEQMTKIQVRVHVLQVHVHDLHEFACAYVFFIFHSIDEIRRGGLSLPCSARQGAPQVRPCSSWLLSRVPTPLIGGTIGRWHVDAFRPANGIFRFGLVVFSSRRLLFPLALLHFLGQKYHATCNPWSHEFSSNTAALPSRDT